MSDAQPPTWPKVTLEDRDAFRALVPHDERVAIRPMFGSLAAFADTQMFMGILGGEIMVRLSDVDRQNALAAGSSLFEPMPGKPMREYVTVPGWRDNPDRVRELAERSMAYALSLPPKKPRRIKR